MNGELMKEAYGMLYEIEIGLREEIKRRMLMKYGPLWQYIAPTREKRQRLNHKLNHLKIYELEHYLQYSIFNDLRKRNNSLFQTLLIHLRSVYPVRNKIAHFDKISEKDFQDFQEHHDFIMQTLKLGNK